MTTGPGATVSGAAGPSGASTSGAAGPSVEPIAAELLSTLRDARLAVGTAESLTGGLVVAALTAAPGASASVAGGVVSYATRVKRDVLGVDGALLASRGAVDPDVAAQMAEGVCRVLGCDVGLATTGVAGPEPQDGQPVGTVFVAVAVPGATPPRTWVKALDLSGGRDGIRRSTVSAVLRLALDTVRESTGAARADDSAR